MTATLDKETEADRAHRYRWWILAIIGVAQLMVVLDATIVTIALPDAMKDLGFGDADRQWIVTGYALSFGSLLLLGGRLSDVMGRRAAFLIGLVGFGVASAVGGFAENFAMLVAARVGQGAFGALLAPAAMSLLTTTFIKPDERAKAFGIFGAIGGAGAAVGLLLGGVLTEYASWRWTLFVNLVFAAIAIFGALTLMRNDRPATRARIDIPGTVTITAGLFAVVYGFSNAERNGWSDPHTIAFLAAGVILLGVFVYIESIVAHPVLPLRVLADRNRSTSYLAIFLVGIGMFGVFLFLTFYLQQILQWSPVQNGLGFLPMVAAIMLTATLGSASLLPRFGPRWLVFGGMISATVGMFLLTQLEVDSTYAAHILPGLILMGLGMGAVMAPAMQGAVSGIGPEDAGVASALVNTMQQIGGSIGTALLSTLVATAATNYAEDHLTSFGSPEELLAQASVHSYSVAYWFSAGVFAVGALLTVVGYRSGTLPDAAEGTVVVAH